MNKKNTGKKVVSFLWKEEGLDAIFSGVSFNDTPDGNVCTFLFRKQGVNDVPIYYRYEIFERRDRRRSKGLILTLLFTSNVRSRVECVSFLKFLERNGLLIRRADGPADEYYADPRFITCPRFVRISDTMYLHSELLTLTNGETILVEIWAHYPEYEDENEGDFRNIWWFPKGHHSFDEENPVVFAGFLRICQNGNTVFVDGIYFNNRGERHGIIEEAIDTPTATE